VSERPRVPIARVTEHLEIHADGVAVCVGTANEYERHVLFVASQLGLDDLRTDIPVFLYSDPTPEACHGNGGCTMSDGVAHGNPASMHHELVHSVACELRASTVPALGEGLAVMFEPHSVSRQPAVPLAEFLAAPYPFVEYYGTAGHFMRWLLENRGAMAIADLYVSTSPESDAAGLERGIEDIWNGDFASMEEQYDNDAPFAWVPLQDCADIPHLQATPSDGWVWSKLMNCESEETFGPYHTYDLPSADFMYQSFSFDVPEDATYAFELVNLELVRLERCLQHHPVDEAEADVLLAPIDITSDFQQGLTAGLWRASLLKRHGPPEPVGLAVRLFE
jgi:hypothetical protein